LGRKEDDRCGWEYKICAEDRTQPKNEDKAAPNSDNPILHVEEQVRTVVGKIIS
jgi:hypothetical protein